MFILFRRRFLFFQVFSCTFSMATVAVRKPLDQAKDQRLISFYHRPQILVKKLENTNGSLNKFYNGVIDF